MKPGERSRLWLVGCILLIALVWLASRVAVVFPRLGQLIVSVIPIQGSNSGGETALRGHIEQINTTLRMYRKNNGALPTTEQGLKALVTKPESEPRPRSWREYLPKPILDPWKQEYFYEYPGKHNPKSYDIYSAGADRKPGTADDIGNWDAPAN